MKTLIHSCCAPCLLGPLRELQEEGRDPAAYFYNPNVHPLIEFRRRLKAMKVLQERLSVRVIYREDYGLWEFLEQVEWRGEDRCRDCYRMRLAETARLASEEGCGAFTTTLLASSHQRHEVVWQVGERCAAEAGVEFLYRDWRHLAEENHRRARKLNLYLQQYCGCVFSEYERYVNTGRHLYRGPGG